MDDSPPVLIGEKVFWLGSGSGLPKRGKVKWIGKLPQIGPSWTIGVELEERLPYGGIDGSWGPRKLFSCKQNHGLIVPASSIVPDRQGLPLSHHSSIPMNETSSAFARERATRQIRRGSDEEFLKGFPKNGKVKNKEFVSPLQPEENRLENFRNGYSAQPITSRVGGNQNPLNVESVQVREEGIVYSWMVDNHFQNERLVFKRMGFRRRELNRSLDDGLIESPRNSFHSSRSSGSKRDRSSGIFALFQWFKKQKSDDSSDLDVSSGPNSPILPRSTSITGSVDTLFSTATANSFAFVHPLQYRPFGSANPPEIRIAIGPETSTYRKRVKERDRLRYLEKNISLREKYRLYGSGTLPRSADHINELSDERLLDVKKSFDFPHGSNYSTLGRQKRKAPPPPVCKSSNSEVSLPSVTDHNVPENCDLVKQHRRASSEPVKYVKLNCHVKGKRKAPPPPGFNNSTDSDVLSLCTSNSNSSKRSRKKRKAPSPPTRNIESNDNHIVEIIREATDSIFTDKNSILQKEDSKDETASNASTLDIGSSSDILCTDTLKLERGILKQNMDKPFSEPQLCPSSPVSPRPWYKRTTANREPVSVKEKEKKCERDRRKVEDWMLESGFPRRSFLNSDNRYNLFSKVDKTDEKRKSQISILTNISELDREAAEIIRRGKEKEKSLIESQNAMYFNNEAGIAENENGKNISEESETPRRSSAKELITLFNAITNVTKVTVHSSFFSKDNNSIFSKVKDKKPKIQNEDKEAEINTKKYSNNKCGEIDEDILIKTQVDQNELENKIENKKPSSSSSISSSSSGGKIARVTIEELDEYDAERNSKSQVIYEANRQNRHLSPPIPTITEVSEGSVKSSPTSTITSSNASDPSPASPEPIHMKHMQVWICPRCTLENLRWRITCEACDMWRPNPFELREKAFQGKLLNNDSESQNKNGGEIKNTSSHLYPNLSKIKLDNNKSNTSSSQENKNEMATTKEEKNDLKVNENSAKDNLAEKNYICSDKTDHTNMELKIETEIKENEQNEEVRKARIAFFSKTKSSDKEDVSDKHLKPKEEKEINKPTTVIINEDEEKKKLKEMLIDLKHSLPKRPKPVKKIESVKTEDKNDKETHVEATKKRDKILPPENELINSHKSGSSIEENKAEAYLVESETIVEEIKLKKPLEKVSSSVQTSGLVKQICPKPTVTSGKEVLIPIKVEEHVIKDGVLYTSVTSDTRRIGTGTFELLRPRDFANIEAVKTESKSNPLHLYANINDDDGDKEVKTEKSPLNSLEYLDKLSKQLTKPQGVANFKARLDMSSDKNVNTLAVNRLLKRLEVAIAGGNHELAATLARELAQLKVNCSVIRQKSITPGNEILVEMYVEDRVSHQGPFPIKLQPSTSLRLLKEKIEREYEIPAGVQRWIIGKQLAADDELTLDNMGINKDGCPIFLYLVAPDSAQQITNVDLAFLHPKLSSNTTVNIEICEKDLQEAGPSGLNIKKSPESNATISQITSVSDQEINSDRAGTLVVGWKCDVCTLMNSPLRPGCAACTTERPKDYVVPEQYKLNEADLLKDNVTHEEKLAKVEEEEKVKNYQKLVDLEKDDLIIYSEAFECPVCLTDYPPMEGIVLRECLHVFCRNCISNTIQFSEEAEVKCPFRDNNYTCDSSLLQREIKALVPPEIYEEHLAKSIALAETKIGNAFHCKTPDCKGWCIFEDNVNIFRCPVCTHTNCLTCQAIHEGLDCKQFQEQLNSNSDMNIEAKRTKEMLQEMVARGEAMNCPTCQVVLMKKWGCDWLRCSMCKTEICWVTRGPRWGPNGKGDTSGGCQCGVNGIKCHPKCTYCH